MANGQEVRCVRVAVKNGRILRLNGAVLAELKSVRRFPLTGVYHADVAGIGLGMEHFHGDSTHEVIQQIGRRFLESTGSYLLFDQLTYATLENHLKTAPIPGSI